VRIILCCGHNGRAIVIGDVKRKPVKGKPVTLTDARMVLRWDAACGGLFGLAAKGPRADTRITHSVPETVSTVWQEWCTVSDVASKELDKWPAVS